MTRARSRSRVSSAACALAVLVVCMASPALAGSRAGGIEAQIGERIATQARERLALPEATVRVVQVEVQGGLPRGAELVGIEIASRGAPVGWVTARATVSAKRREREVWVKAEIEVLVPTVVAARRLERGAVLGEDDVQVVARPLRDGRFAGLEAVLGGTLRRTLEPGETLGRHEVHKQRLVARGDEVIAVLEGEGFALRAAAEALEDGARGDEIAVRMKIGGNKVVRGVVSDARRVEVR